MTADSVQIRPLPSCAARLVHRDGRAYSPSWRVCGSFCGKPELDEGAAIESWKCRDRTSVDYPNGSIPRRSYRTHLPCEAPSSADTLAPTCFLEGQSSNQSFSRLRMCQDLPPNSLPSIYTDHLAVFARASILSLRPSSCECSLVAFLWVVERTAALRIQLLHRMEASGACVRHTPVPHLQTASRSRARNHSRYFDSQIRFLECFPRPQSSTR